MEAYRHFGLSRPPFEVRPDPFFYYETPAHTEAIATVQYAVHAGKTCCVIVGESGSGKTLIGRVLADQLNRSTRVLWIHGFGQPADATETHVYQPGRIDEAATLGNVRAEVTTLAAWMRSVTPASPPNVVIVDNADALPRRGWIDLLSLLTREFRITRPTTLVLLGLPRLLAKLATPALVRLRRRIYRTCELAPLTQADVPAYIRFRLARAGSTARPFTPAAEEMIFRLSGGNPALVNQIADNALVDAFGDERTTVDAEHVVEAVRAIVGPPPRHPLLSTRAVEQLGATLRALGMHVAANDLRPPFSDAPRRLPMAAATSTSSGPADVTVQGTAGRADAELRARTDTPRPDNAPAPVAAALVEELAAALSVPDAPEKHPPGPPPRRMTPARSASMDAAKTALICERLEIIQERVHQALARVRAARMRGLHIAPAASTEPPTAPDTRVAHRST